MQKKGKGKRKKLSIKKESLRKLDTPNLENVAGGATELCLTGNCLDSMGCATIGCDPFKTFLCKTFGY